MKPLRWVTEAKEAEYMRRMRDINLERSLSNVNENWMADKLHGWSRQAIKGFRIFDLWNHDLLCAVEVDGPEHDRAYDNYRDEYNYRRSGILVFRVRNKVESDAEHVLACIDRLTSGITRKHDMGIMGSTKEAKRKLSSQPYDPDRLMFLDYMSSVGHRPYWV